MSVWHKIDACFAPHAAVSVLRRVTRRWFHVVFEIAATPLQLEKTYV